MRKAAQEFLVTLQGGRWREKETLIKKTYDRHSIEKDFQINDYAMDIKGGRKEIGRIQSGVSKNNILNTAVTAVEGIGLGALNIGLPDIVIWVGVLLRGVYETALKYGFDYDSPEEKLFILKMIETAMLSGEELNRWEGCSYVGHPLQFIDQS